MRAAGLRGRHALPTWCGRLIPEDETEAVWCGPSAAAATRSTRLSNLPPAPPVGRPTRPCESHFRYAVLQAAALSRSGHPGARADGQRSEERRVGKEGRSRRWTERG